MRIAQLICLAVVLLLFSACKTEFELISYGHDQCTHCKMTIIDRRYAAELLTKKGKASKFDDIACLKKYLKDQNLPETDLSFFVADYSTTNNKFLDARQAVYLHSEVLRSPMNGNLAAFTSAGDAGSLKDSLKADLLKWEDLN